MDETEGNVMDDPVWIANAKKYLGMRETKGPQHNPTILKWWKELNQPFRDDETAWCGAFVGGVLAESGKSVVTGPASARSWLRLPVKLTEPAVGAVVIFWRGDRNGYQGHVGFVVGKDKQGHLMVLGGNQGDMVSIKPFGKDRVLGYRWPGTAPDPARYVLPLIASDGKVSQNEA